MKHPAPLLLAGLVLLSGCDEQNYYTDSDVTNDPDLPPAGIDTDGDGLDDLDEVLGWEIAVDFTGFGPGTLSDPLEPFVVTSDPELFDTDGDGLSDLEEQAYKTDPRTGDTDQDGLTDADELAIWKTSPVSVDSDGDARGPDPDAGLPPNPQLFDGNEQFDLGTSPSLADTDGDNRTDYEEFDDPLGHPLIADLPEVRVDFEGEIDIRLLVEYAESMGSSTEYGSSFSTTSGTSSSKSTSNSVAVKKEADSGGFGMISDVVEGGASGGFAGAATVAGTAVAEVGHSALCDAAGIEGQPTPSATMPSFDASNPTQAESDADAWGAAIESGDAVDYLDASGLCAPATPETTTTTTQSLTQESHQSATEEYSTYQTESREQTETSSTGSVKLGARISNIGDYAFELSDLYITMTQWQTNPSPNGGLGSALGTGSFRTLATLTPTAVDNVVLGPGTSTPIIELEDDGVNSSIIKQFLARPTAIFYQPAGFELSNEHGIDYQFLTENTFGQTATVVIERGDGSVQRHQVATNVNRHIIDNPMTGDEAGELAGITLAEVLSILDVPYTTIQADRPVDEVGTLAEIQVLDSLDGLGCEFPDPLKGEVFPSRTLGTGLNPKIGSPSAFWSIHTSLPSDQLLGVDFESIRLHHGDTLRMLYVQDRDGDGLYSDEEALHGSVDSAVDVFDNFTWLPGSDGIPDSVDTDRDGLTDFTEVKHGWRVAISRDAEFAVPSHKETVEEFEASLGYTSENIYYWTYSDPTQADADGDGANDLTEMASWLDPNNPDTDDDGVPELHIGAQPPLDPFPNTPARRLYVTTDGPGGDGESWETAYTSIYDALQEASDTVVDGDPLNDVSQVWVAAGTYLVDEGYALQIWKDLQVYGGFQGFETTLAQRNTNPYTLETIFSGDINGDDGVEVGGPLYDDNAEQLITFVGPKGTFFGDSYGILDGVVVSASQGTAIEADYDVTIRNCRIERNYSTSIRSDDPAQPHLKVENTVFRYNTALDNNALEGVNAIVHGNDMDLSGCTFRGNEGCALLLTGHADGGDALVRDCVFIDNFVEDGQTLGVAPPTPGVPIAAVIAGEYHGGPDTLRIENCEIRDNWIGAELGAKPFLIHWIGSPTSPPSASLIQCRISDNYLKPSGSQDSGSVVALIASCSVLNTTIANNHVDAEPLGVSGSGVLSTGTNSLVQNSILWNNVLGSGPGIGGGPLGDTAEVRNTIAELVLTDHPGFGNMELDPLLTASLEVSGSSPAIDAGDELADYDLTMPGIQGPPETDAFGNDRLTDGDGDGVDEIDIGAFEAAAAILP